MLRGNVTVEAMRVPDAPFPVSDPAVWTPAVVRPVPFRSAVDDGGDLAGRSVARALASLAGAIGVALAFPLVIVAIGVPIVLVVRALVAVAQGVIATIP